MRIYKTRSIAADACKNGRVTLNGVQLKPSRTFKIGDRFNVRKGPITYTFRVLQLSENRLGAKLVPEYMQDCTDPNNWSCWNWRVWQVTAAGTVAPDGLPRKTGGR